MLDVREDGRVFYNGELVEQTYTPKGMKVSINGREYYVHNLVGERYLEGYKPFYKVTHVDGNVTNNQTRNLQVEIPLDSLGVKEPGKRPITLRHKKTGARYKFNSIREASVFMGYKRNYLEQYFYTTGKNELSWFHEYTIVEIAPKDTRTINRDGKTIFLRNLTTGEVHYFLSLTKASRFLGRNPQYVKTRLQRGLNLPIESGYEIIEVRG
jgi:hypothetical protein